MDGIKCIDALEENTTKLDEIVRGTH